MQEKKMSKHILHLVQSNNIKKTAANNIWNEHDIMSTTENFKWTTAAEQCYEFQLIVLKWMATFLNWCLHNWHYVQEMA